MTRWKHLRHWQIWAGIVAFVVGIQLLRPVDSLLLRAALGVLWGGVAGVTLIQLTFRYRLPCIRALLDEERASRPLTSSPAPPAPE